MSSCATSRKRKSPWSGLSLPAGAHLFKYCSYWRGRCSFQQSQLQLYCISMIPLCWKSSQLSVSRHLPLTRYVRVKHLLHWGSKSAGLNKSSTHDRSFLVRGSSIHDNLPASTGAPPGKTHRRPSDIHLSVTKDFPEALSANL